MANYTNCTLTSGFALGCKAGPSGVKTWYLGQYEKGLTFDEDTTGLITGSTISSGTTFVTLEQKRETASYTDTPTPSIENDNIYYVPEAMLIVNGQTADKRNTIKLIGKNTLFVIAERMDGQYVLLGKTNGMELSVGELGSGTAATDRDGGSLTLTGLEEDPAQFIEYSVISALVSA